MQIGHYQEGAESVLLGKLNPLTHGVFAITLSGISFAGLWIHLPYLVFLLIQCPLVTAAGISRRLSRIGLILITPFFLFLFAIYGLIFPGAETILVEWWVFPVSLEGLRSAYEVFGRVLVMMTAFLFFSMMVRPSRMVQALAQKGVPWPICYIVLATLQTIPQLSAKASAIIDAQRTRGLETEGGIARRIKAIVPLVKPLVFSSLVKAQERAFALEMNGAGLKGPKTYLIELPDSVGEKRFRRACLTAVTFSFIYKLWSLLKSII